MDKMVVIFESKYGFTERYAQWIAEALSCPVFERKKLHPQDLVHYDTILYGGGLYAGGVSGIKLITQNWQLLCRKHVILFTCGIADPADPANVHHIRESLSKILSAQMLEQLHIFHLRGGMDYSRLGLVHKSMMSMLRKMLLKKEEQGLGPEEKLLLETYGKYIDFTDRESIQPLVACALSLHTGNS